MKAPLHPILETKLAGFRKRVWIVKLTEGLLAALFGLALSYVVVFALDRVMETPAWLRATILAAGAAVLGIGLPLKWHRWVWRQRRLEDAARLLRHRFPRLGDQLLGIVELARLENDGTGRSERLVEAAMAQAAEAVKDKDFTDAVPQAAHRRWGWAAGGVLAIAVIALVVAPGAAFNALVRWITPWRDVERYTFARVESLPDRLVVPYAEPFDLPVKLAGDTQWSPDSGRARIQGQDAVRAERQDRVFPFAFPPQKQDAPLSISLGDVRKTIELEPRLRPELTALAVRLKLPEYLQYKTTPVIEIRGGSVSVLKGAEASFEGTASRDLASAEMDGQPQNVKGPVFNTNYQSVKTDRDAKLSWADADHLTPREPLVLRVQAIDDEAPRIVARRDSVEQVVLDSEVVAFDVNAMDDFGLKRVGLEWRGFDSVPDADGKNESAQPKTRGEKIAAAGGAETKSIDAKATFCATREGVAPQSLEVRAWTEDYLPGRKRSYSAAFVLHVLNKTDHALWLTEQFGKWLGAARESYEREQQLHETNKELRSMTVADLDRPENRRRVAQQAAAENANASRLDSLTSAGRQLVEQATRNDEFDARRLESWATMLKSLQDIAAKRMPSVADLLKQGANAQNGGKQLATAPSANGQQQTPQQQQQQPQPANAGPAKPGAPSVSQGQTPVAAGAPKPADPNAKPKPAAPSIADRENGFSKPPEPPPADPNAKPAAPGGGKLRLPQTTLGAAAAKKNEAAPAPPQSPAQQRMEQAVTEQKDLLAEFAKVADELGTILASLEASTFVKRLKAASRQQLAIATDINQKTLAAFGVEQKPVDAAAPIAKQAKDQSEVVRVIQSDMDAYFQRKQDSRFKNILDQMRKTEIVRALARGGEKVSTNLTGQGMIGSEYWADTMDRWAEELVAASNCKSCSSCSGDSLPPEIVLKVMQSLRDEMKLRDETRELENAKAALEAKKYVEGTQALGRKQGDIGQHTQGALDDILALPQGAEKFPKELKLLNAVIMVMEEAQGILLAPDTGPKAIAAETEAIELLLQTKRMKPGGGGGGSSPGGGGTAASASSAALADIGPGADANTSVAARAPGQATGRAGREFPAEFKAGLDAYFNNLEAQPADK